MDPMGLTFLERTLDMFLEHFSRFAHKSSREWMKASFFSAPEKCLKPVQKGKFVSKSAFSRQIFQNTTSST